MLNCNENTLILRTACHNTIYCVSYLNRAGGKGTAGTAMAVPVFEGEKMASLGF